MWICRSSAEVLICSNWFRVKNDWNLLKQSAAVQVLSWRQVRQPKLSSSNSPKKAGRCIGFDIINLFVRAQDQERERDKNKGDFISGSSVFVCFFNHDVVRSHELRFGEKTATPHLAESKKKKKDHYMGVGQNPVPPMTLKPFKRW